MLMYHFLLPVKYQLRMSNHVILNNFVWRINHPQKTVFPSAILKLKVYTTDKKISMMHVRIRNKI